MNNDLLNKLIYFKLKNIKIKKIENTVVVFKVFVYCNNRTNTQNPLSKIYWREGRVLKPIYRVSLRTRTRPLPTGNPSSPLSAHLRRRHRRRRRRRPSIAASLRRPIPPQRRVGVAVACDLDAVV